MDQKLTDKIVKDVEAIANLFSHNNQRAMPNLNARTLPCIDMFKTETGVELRADLPGLDKEHIRLTIEKNMLTLSGKRTRDVESKSENFYCRECYYGSFSRQLKLPFDADQNLVTAKFSGGVLIVNIPQPEVTKAHSIAIE